MDRLAQVAPGQVPQGHLDTGHSATLPRMVPKLFDLAKQSLHVAGIFTQQPALEKERIFFCRTIPHVTVADAERFVAQIEAGIEAIREDIEL